MQGSNIADAYIMSAQKAHGLDRAAGTRPGNKQMRYAVTGTAASTRDQADFFSVRGAVAESGNTLAPTIAPSATNFTNAQVAEFLAHNPMELRNINIVGMDATALSSLQVKTRRETPFASEQAETTFGSGYQSPQDFQTTRISIPVGVIFDGYTFLRLINDGQTSAVTYTVAFLFGPRQDRRAEVPQSGGAIVQSPGVR